MSYTLTLRTHYTLCSSILYTIFNHICIPYTLVCLLRCLQVLLLLLLLLLSLLFEFEWFLVAVSSSKLVHLCLSMCICNIMFLNHFYAQQNSCDSSESDLQKCVCIIMAPSRLINIRIKDYMEWNGFLLYTQFTFHILDFCNWANMWILCYYYAPVWAKEIPSISLKMKSVKQMYNNNANEIE